MSKPIVVYDDTCGMCRNSTLWVRRLDWLRRLDDLGYSQAVERYPEIGRGELGDGLRLRYPDGSVALGVDAIRGIAMRTPLGALGAGSDSCVQCARGYGGPSPDY